MAIPVQLVTRIPTALVPVIPGNQLGSNGGAPSITIVGTPEGGSELYATLVNPLMFALVHDGYTLLYNDDTLVYPDLQWYIDGIAVPGAEGRYFTVPLWVSPEAEITVGNSDGVLSDPVAVSPYDSDAGNYIARVEEADSEALEPEVKWAMNEVFVSLKGAPAPIASSHWEALADGGTAVLLAGPRTIAGSLIPLHPSMVSPTNVNFVSGDKNRTTGWKGGFDRRIHTGLLNNANPQNDASGYAYLTEGGTRFSASTAVFACGVSDSSQRRISHGGNAAGIAPRCNNVGDLNKPSTYGEPGGWGVSRYNSTSHDYVMGSSSGLQPTTSSTPINAELSVFAPYNDAGRWDDCRISLYAFGRAVDLSIMDEISTRYLNRLINLNL